MPRLLAALALSDLGRDALKFVIALALAIMLALAFSVSTLMTVLGATVPGHEVAEANLGLQFDLYHRQVEEGDVAMAIDEFAALTRHYQIASPPDRGEPDAGEMNYRWLFEKIDAMGFQGYIGCEYRPRAGTLAGLKWAAACGVSLG